MVSIKIEKASPKTPPYRSESEETDLDKAERLHFNAEAQVCHADGTASC